jgi:hypothetical protein
MNTDAMQDSAKVVISGLQPDGILPGGKEEMWRDLHLLPGAHLKGAAWGNSLTIEGAPVEADSAVYTRGAIKIKASLKEGADTGIVNFSSSVTSPDSVVIEDVPFRVRFMSCVYTGVANLNNCIVYGNLYARRCTLQNSIVLGGVYCQGHLQIENSLVSTFRAKRVTIGPGVTLLFPAAMAEESIQMDHPVRALPFFDLSGTSQENSSTRGGMVLMDQRDVYFAGEDLAADGSSRSWHVLSIYERILDASRSLELLRRNQRFLECLALGRHLDPLIRDAFLGRVKHQLEERLWDLLKGEPLPEIDDSTAIAELVHRTEIQGSIFRMVSDEAAYALTQSFPTIH